MKGLSVAAVAVMVLAPHLVASGIGPSQVAITVSPSELSVVAGASPEFDITLTNRMNVPVRIIDARRGGPLQRMHFSAIVEQGPGRLSTEHGEFTTPPVTGNSAHTIIPVGGRYSFHLTQFRGPLPNLPPGTYSVRISYFARRRGEVPWGALSDPIKLTVLAR